MLNNLFHKTDELMKQATLSMIERTSGKSSTLLDLGCGNCQFTAKIIPQMWCNKVILVDSVPLEERKGLVENNRWQLIYGDLNEPLTGIADSSVDVAHAGQVIEHLNNTDLFIKEIKRVLKPDGYCVISTPNLASWHNLIWLVLGKQPMTCMVSDEMIVGEVSEVVNEPRHRRIFTIDGLKQLLEHHGLEVISQKGAGYYPFTGKVAKFLSKLDPKHSAYIVIKAKRRG